MVENNFCYMYHPEENISIDEACCPFKGWLHFRYYNPLKPNHFHIKLFQLSESISKYIIGFAGKGTSSAADASRPMDPLCKRTTNLALSLMEKFHLLDKGHQVYMDNNYTSPELF